MPKLRNDSDKTWNYATAQGEDFDEGGSAFKQQEWGKNCVMFALSKVLGESSGVLAKRIVDQHLGGVQRIEDLANAPVIKSVLAALGFTSLIEGGGKWSDMRTRIHTKAPRRLFAIYWRNKSAEDWSNKDVQPGRSDHAFTILAYSTCMLLPKTNDASFDGAHPDNADWISVWCPPAGDGIETDRTFTVVGSGFRRFDYG
jgi:hypothetical protein